MNEWGEYTNKNGLSSEIPFERVIDATQNNNQAITQVVVNDSRGGDRYSQLDWGAAGKCLAVSKHVKHLVLDCQQPFISPSDYRSFSQGAALNKSLESIQFRGRHSSSQCYENTKLLFGCLHPLFAENTSIKFIAISDIPFCDSIGSAIKSCQFLKSIKISQEKIVVGDDSVANWESFFHVIFNKPGLHHVSLKNCLLSKNACHEIRKCLSDENCTMKSLMLYPANITNESDCGMISDGIAVNGSLKCLRYWGSTVNSFLELIGGIRFTKLEKVDLGTGRDNVHITGNVLSEMIEQQMSVVNSLVLRHIRLDEYVWRSIVKTPLISSMELHEFGIPGYLQDLGSLIATRLKVLRISTGGGCKKEMLIDKWCAFFNSMHASKLEEIYLDKVIINGMLASLSDCLASLQAVRVLSITRWHLNMESAEWSSFASMLESNTTIEELDLSNISSFQRNAYELIANALNVNSSIRRLKIILFGIDQLQPLIDILGNQSCTMEEWRIEYDPGPVNQLSQLSHILMQALQRNSSLKVLEFNYTGNLLFQFDWLSFSSLLCNKSSIDATYHSNHTLHTLLLRRYPIPVEIYSMLHSNRNSNKHAVAREKIVHNHTFNDVDFVLSFLPNVLGSIGNANSNQRLSRMYEILRKVPYEFHQGQEQL